MIFDERYEVFLADTPESKALQYQLRYKVFCIETGWEPSRLSRAEKHEKDEFDVSSHHFLVRDRRSLAWVAGLRLVESPSHALPIAQFCQIEEQPRRLFAEGGCVEVSRLFVLPDFRSGRLQSADGRDLSRVDVARNNEIILGLIRAAREFVLKNDINSWYFLVEPALARMLKRLGIDLYRCGPGVQHRGLRYPCYGDIETCFNRVFLNSEDIGLMFSKVNTFGYCSWLEKDELGEKVPEARNVDKKERKLVIA